MSPAPAAMREIAGDDLSTTFKDAMARYPSGVVVATALGRDGDPQGFTASSFCSVSLHPPLILVCLSATARSHPVFESARHFAVSVLRAEHEAVAERFGTRGADKFADSAFEPREHGLFCLRDALAVLICETQSLLPAGDHSILIGRADVVRLGPPGPALVHHQRRYWELGEEA